MNDKTKKHMSDETKVILIKASIVVTGILEVGWCVLLGTAEKGMYGDKSQEVLDFCLPLFGVVGLSCFVTHVILSFIVHTIPLLYIFLITLFIYKV